MRLSPISRQLYCPFPVFILELRIEDEEVNANKDTWESKNERYPPAVPKGASIPQAEDRSKPETSGDGTHEIHHRCFRREVVETVTQSSTTGGSQEDPECWGQANADRIPKPKVLYRPGTRRMTQSWS
jgi:hypothetical protein